MKAILTWLTLLLLGSVVGVLATYLILIAASLWRANANLAAAAAHLEAVRDYTAPLGDDLSAINGAVGSLRAPLHGVNESLRNVSIFLEKSASR